MKYLAVTDRSLNHLRFHGRCSRTLAVYAGNGRENGLRVDRYADERTDYYKSTHAAAHYLTVLFNTYRDWLLVVAAYNGGPVM